MTWTKEDTEDLRSGSGQLLTADQTGACPNLDFTHRAADEIERLQKRVAELEAERAEVARELRVMYADGEREFGIRVGPLLDLATCLERKGET